MVLAEYAVIGLGLAIIGAGLAVGHAAGGSGMGQGITASAAVGAVAEKEYSFGKMLTLIALPETQAIYGLVIAIIILFVIANTFIALI
ncbi:MAG TPA: V-type ATP synthase subunit K [archaeon]|nr:V-type ATP synthase subunit K [archaeon]